MSERRDYVALEWVSREIEETLKQARQALENYVSEPIDMAQMHFCLNYIHQVHATLKMVEFPGPLLFGQEMEALASAIVNNTVSDRAAAYETLMGSMLRMPLYLAQVKNDRNDVPGVLKIAVDELRKARNAPAFEAGELFAPKLHRVPKGGKSSELLSAAEFEDLVKKLRQIFQAAFVDIVRNKRWGNNVRQLAKVCQRLRLLSKGKAREPFWLTALAILEGLVNRSIPANAVAKVLLKEVDNELKALLAQGLDYLNQPIDDEVLKQLLYHIAKSNAASPLITEVQDLYGLHESFIEVTGSDVTVLRDSEAMRAALVVLLEEIARVKDVIDIFERSGTRSMSQLATVEPLYRRISQTLSMLSMRDLLLSVEAQEQTLGNYLRGGQVDDSSALHEIANGLVGVENSILQLIDSLFVSADDRVPVPVQEARKRVIRESRNILELAKQATVDYVASRWDPAVLSNVPSLLRNIRGGLSMAGLDRAAGLLVLIEAYIKQELLVSNAAPDWQKLDRMADAISTIDYYLERVEGSRQNESDYLLDEAAVYLAEMGYESAPNQGDQPRAIGEDFAVIQKQPDPTLAAQELLTIDMAKHIVDEEINVTVVEDPAPVAMAAHPWKVATARDEDHGLIDQEIIEIFLDEVTEVLATITHFLPLWRAGEGGAEPLTEVRRGFHTLKGSGRTVGATDLGEVAWSVENMLNRVLDNTVPADAQRILFVEKVLALIPGLVESFHQAVPTDRELCEEIERIGKRLTEDDAQMQNAIHKLDIKLPVRLGTEAVSADTSEQDEFQLLLDIFESEAKTHMATIDNYVARAHATGIPRTIGDDIHRALHTLKGGANISGLINLVNVVTPVEKLVKHLQMTQARLEPDVIDLLEQTSVYVREELSRLKLGEQGQLAGIDSFLRRVEWLHHGSEPGQAEIDSALVVRHGEFVQDASVRLAEVESLLELWKELELDQQDLAESVDHLRHVATGAQDFNYPAITDLAGALSVALASVQQPTQLDAMAAQQLESSLEGLIGMLDCVVAGLAINAWPVALLEQIAALNLTPAPHKEDIATPAIAVTVEDEIDVATVEVANLASQAMEIEARHAAEVLEQEEAAARAEAELLALQQAEADSRAIAAQVALEQAAQQQNTEQQRQQAEKDAGEQAEAQARAAAEHAARTQAEAEARARAEQEASRKAEAEARAQAERLAREKAEVEARLRAEQEARRQAELQARAHAEQEAREQAARELQAREQAAARASALAEQEAREKAAREQAEAEANRARIEQAEREQAAAEANRARVEQAEREQAEAEANRVRVEQAKRDQAAAQAIADAEAAQKSRQDARPEQPQTVYSLGEDVDPEILEIFLEEANDMLESTDEIMHRWADEPDNRSYLEQYLRFLHTLKGGSRMAGLYVLGDATHDLETQLEEIRVGGNQELDASLLKKIQRFQDQLNKLLGQISNAQPITVNLLDVVHDRVGAAPGLASVTPVVEPEPKGTAERPSNVVSLDRAREIARESEEFDAPVLQPAMEPMQARAPQEMIKISTRLMENLVNLAGETSISRARVEVQMSDVSSALNEMDITIDRMLEQLRRLQIETEAQIIFRQEQVEQLGLEEFDPLEMDRYSALQQLSRSLMESASDILEIKGTISTKERDIETLLLQQSRINTDLQEGLMRSRMVPFSRLVPRLRRIVRQLSSELNKEVELEFGDISGQIDRTLLERMLAPFEHMIRNAIDHGIEPAAQRIAKGKPAVGRITIDMAREGGDVVIALADDGRGINLAAVRAKAIETGLMDEEATLTDREIMHFIFSSGFSTAAAITQISGRGVGMDVVNSEVRQMGGSLEIDSEPDEGTEFEVRLPFTVSVNRSLMVRICGETFALPLNTIEGIVRVSPFELEAYYQQNAPDFEYGGQSYKLRYMGGYLHKTDRPNLEGLITPLPVILVRSADHSVAVQVDAVMGSQEVVVKSLGLQFNAVPGLAGATVMGDGSVVVILDLLSMIRAEASHGRREQLLAQAQRGQGTDRNLLVMVVDDSVTVRKVASRFLERNGMNVIVAKDGLEAMQMLQVEKPDVMLLDIEMPRMDGFEVAERVKRSQSLKDITIIMITSRTGDKHRERAMSLGVEYYLGKPYQENELLSLLREVEALVG